MIIFIHFQIMEQDKENADPRSSSPSPSISSKASNGTKKAINRGRWTKEEDKKLNQLIETRGERWEFIAAQYPDRTDVQCQQRWSKVLNPDIKKGKAM